MSKLNFTASLLPVSKKLHKLLSEQLTAQMLSNEALTTSLYLVFILPLFGVNLPFIKTMIAVTFFAGLLPILGNLLSNALIIGVGFTISHQTAFLALAFLVVTGTAPAFCAGARKFAPKSEP